MNSSMLFLELSLSVGKDEFEKLLNSAYKNAIRKDHRMYETDYGHIDESLVKKGICVAYQSDKKKKKIRLNVCPSVVIGDDIAELWELSSNSISLLTDRLEKHIRKYFNSDYGLDAFKLSRVDFAADIDVGSSSKVLDYIKILHNIGRVKCFSPLKRDQDGEKINKEYCFALKGNSNGVEFWASKLKHRKDILRVEVRLTKPGTIRVYSGETGASKLIKNLAKNNECIFMDTFQYIIPRGDYYKKMKAEKLVRERGV